LIDIDTATHLRIYMRGSEREIEEGAEGESKRIIDIDTDVRMHM